MNAFDRPHFAFLDHDKPLAFAHQGGAEAGWDKRNTMPAFEAAYDLGYRFFETDAICSADDKVLAFHGSANRREQRRSGLPLRKMLQSLTYDEIKKNHKVGGEEIPLMEEVLQTWPDVRINIDPKTNEAVLPLARLIRDTGVIDRVCVTSFRYKRTKAVAEELGGQEKLCTGLGPLGAVVLRSHGIAAPGYLAYSKAACLQLPHQYVSSRMVLLAFHHGLDVHVWTPNTVEEIDHALDEKVDGIMSDSLVDLKQVMIKRNEWTEAA